MPITAVKSLDLPSIPAAVIQRVARPAELSRVVPECCGLVWNALKAQQAKAGRNLAIYWDSAIRVEAGVEALGPFSEGNGVVRSGTPAGPAATVTWFGPYGGLGAAHEAIRQWSEATGHRLIGANWEIYGHWETAWNDDPSRIRTDVFYQIDRR